MTIPMFTEQTIDFCSEIKKMEMIYLKVTYQFIALIERFTTQCAKIGLFTRMRPLVTLQIVRPRKSFSALTTLIRTLAGMPPHVYNLQNKILNKIHKKLRINKLIICSTCHVT